MSERRKLSLRGPAERKDDAPPRQSWNVSETRRDRLKEMARVNRRNPSDAEKALWARLAGQKAGGFKFHRQVVVGSTIVDFACPARWLVVEISGEGNAELAALQDRKLTDVGVRVLRFAPQDVLEDIEPVIAAILEELQKPFNRKEARAANAAGVRTIDQAAGPEPSETDEMFVTEAEDATGEDNDQ